MTGRYAFLRSGVWVAGALIVVMTVVAFVNLGLWQLRRLDERRATNAQIETLADQEPVPLWTLIAEVGMDPAALEYHPVTVSGVYRVDDEVILQARTLNGLSGHNLVTPLEWSGGVLAVNRGWIPIDSAGPPVPEAAPPSAEVTVTGLLRRSEDRGPTGLVGPDGAYRDIGRLDLVLLEPQWGPGLSPVYLQLDEQRPPPADYPVPLPPLEISEGSHLSYAIQWFLFAAVAAVGFPILVVTTARRRDSRTTSVGTVK